MRLVEVPFVLRCHPHPVFASEMKGSYVVIIHILKKKLVKQNRITKKRYLGLDADASEVPFALRWRR
jgi:hypothetical protein